MQIRISSSPSETEVEIKEEEVCFNNCLNASKEIENFHPMRTRASFCKESNANELSQHEAEKKAKKGLETFSPSKLESNWAKLLPAQNMIFKNHEHDLKRQSLFTKSVVESDNEINNRVRSGNKANKLNSSNQSTLTIEIVSILFCCLHLALVGQVVNCGTENRLLVIGNNYERFQRHRIERQTLASANLAAAVRQRTGATSAEQQANVPYKTFYVTRACEWKSNLFVPKSNDIHFAQSTPHNSHQIGPQPNSAGAVGGATSAESSVLYETAPTFYRLDQRASAPDEGRGGQEDEPGNSRTMLDTDSKALILALPIKMSQTFAGYEPACAIRLIVPRNMRILAKLTSRRLTFAQEQLVGGAEQTTSSGQSQPTLDSGDFNYPHQQPASSGQAQRQLWLNVSQNQFSIETEERIIETEGNVLAFRFLLDRLASKQKPEIRFQVVLTAFQTLGENSDLNTFQQANVRKPSALDSSAQFICDQQRLISANLACDGFENCQDGHDEEAATCLALRNQADHNSSFTAANNFHQQQTTAINHNNNQFSATNNRNQILVEPSSAGGNTFWPKIWRSAYDTNSLAGFFLGFLLVLIMLTCCTCFAYLAYLLYKHHCQRYLAYGRTPASSSSGVASRSAERQNLENSARLAKMEAAALATSDAKPAVRPPEKRRQSFNGSQQPQSILKKPGQLRPMAPPPEVPARRSSASQVRQRGALASSLSAGLSPQHFRPTPAERRVPLSRPARPAPGLFVERGSGQPSPTPPPPPPPLAGPAAPFRGAPKYNLSRTTTTSSQSQQRVSTYHYSSASTKFSESYLNKLAEEQREQQQQEPMDGEAAAPPGGLRTSQISEVSYSQTSKQSSLI